MPRTERKLVAIVDDDDAARHALQFLLEVLGRQPHSFASAADFLASEVDAFACLILDQHMPSMTGLELAQKLRSDGKRLPIMLISGGLTPDVIEKAVRTGIDAVSEKPPELHTLSNFIDQAQAT